MSRYKEERRGRNKRSLFTLSEGGKTTNNLHHRQKRSRMMIASTKRDMRQKTLFSSIFFSVVRKVLRFILSIARALKENHNSLGKNTRKKKERYENKKALKGLSSIHAPLKGPAAPARCSPTNGFQNPRGMSDIFVLVLVVLIDACEKSALFICDVLYLFFVCLFCLSFSFQN